MTDQQKLEAISKLLPDHVSTVFEDIKYVALINNIKEILVDGDQIEKESDKNQRFQKEKRKGREKENRC